MEAMFSIKQLEYRLKQIRRSIRTQPVPPTSPVIAELVDVAEALADTPGRSVLVQRLDQQDANRQMQILQHGVRQS
jgi:hypothetical protein